MRAGRLLRARRAISIGGRYVWHPGRLTRNETPVHAFDLLCACASPSPTELVVVYARGNEVDKKAFDLLKKAFPECTAVPIDIERHDVARYFYKARLLPLFLACLFEYWDEAEIRTDMLERLELAARHTLLRESFREEPPVRPPQVNERSVRTRKWLRATPLWPLTWPVRAVRRVLRYWKGFPRTTPNNAAAGATVE